MTGKIQNLIAGGHFGFIHADNGQNVYFRASAVWEYDLVSLKVGQPVSFELHEGNWPVAANVHVQCEHPLSPTLEKRQAGLELRYAGFDHAKNIRNYIFQRIVPGETIRIFVVSADLALFLKHHIRIQEGPSLCLRALTAELNTLEPRQRPLLHRVLTDNDMLAHVAGLSVPKANRARK